MSLDEGVTELVLVTVMTGQHERDIGPLARERMELFGAAGVGVAGHRGDPEQGVPHCLVDLPIHIPRR